MIQRILLLFFIVHLRVVFLPQPFFINLQQVHVLLQSQFIDSITDHGAGQIILRRDQRILGFENIANLRRPASREMLALSTRCWATSRALP